MEYTVNQVSKIAGVSVRTLHYYDEIGLLKPSFVKANGYRCYEENELLRLQQILFFRELDFPLEKIKEIMQGPAYNQHDALADQEKLLLLKKEHIERLLETIARTKQSLKGGGIMSTDDTFSAFSDPTYQKHKDEVEKRWGKTDAYKQSMQRVGKMSKSDLEKVKAEGEAITKALADRFTQGFVAVSPEVQTEIKKFYEHLRNFYDPSYELFKGLGQMYVDDSRFTEVYEKRAKGMAVFMRDAMAAFVDSHLK